MFVSRFSSTVMCALCFGALGITVECVVKKLLSIKDLAGAETLTNCCARCLRHKRSMCFVTKYIHNICHFVQQGR